MPGDPDRCPQCGDDRAYGYNDDAHVMTCDACGYSEATDLRRQLAQLQEELAEAQARILWLTIATTAEPDDPEELVQWLRGRRTYYEELARQTRQEALEDVATVCDHAQLTTGPKALAAKIRRLAREGGKGEQE